MVTCSKCGKQFEDGVGFCDNCGTSLNNDEVVYENQNLQNNIQPEQNQPNPQSTMPVANLKTSRGLIKMIFLGIITCGIYPLVAYCHIVNDVNLVCTRYDNKKSMHFLGMLILSPFTLEILPLVWFHNICGRMGNELDRRNIHYGFGAKDFWLWGILGSLIAIGPLVFAHKFIKASNKLNESFNKIG